MNPTSLTGAGCYGLSALAANLQGMWRLAEPSETYGPVIKEIKFLEMTNEVIWSSTHPHSMVVKIIITIRKKPRRPEEDIKEYSQSWSRVQKTGTMNAR